MSITAAARAGSIHSRMQQAARDPRRDPLVWKVKNLYNCWRHAPSCENRNKYFESLHALYQETFHEPVPLLNSAKVICWAGQVRDGAIFQDDERLRSLAMQYCLVLESFEKDLLGLTPCLFGRMRQVARAHIYFVRAFGPAYCQATRFTPAGVLRDYPETVACILGAVRPYFPEYKELLEECHQSLHICLLKLAIVALVKKSPNSYPELFNTYYEKLQSLQQKTRNFQDSDWDELVKWCKGESQNALSSLYKEVCTLAHGIERANPKICTLIFQIICLKAQS